MSTMVTELVVPLRGSKLARASVCDTLRERREVRAMTLSYKTLRERILTLSVGAASLRVAMPQALRNSWRRSC